MYSDVNRAIRKLSEMLPISELDESGCSQMFRATEALRRKYIPERERTPLRITHDLNSYWKQIAHA